MTLVLEGMPSSGGPRCFWGRGARGLPALPASLVAASFWLVTSVRGAAWPGTLTGSAAG